MTSFAGLEVRPLESTDRDRLSAAFERLSDASRSARFHGAKARLGERELDRLTRLDHITRDAVIAVERDSGRIVGVARYATDAGRVSAAEIAIVVADEWQGRGLGTALTRLLMWRAATTGFTRLSASVQADNRRAQRLLRRLGFVLRGRDGDALELAVDLRAGRLPRARPVTPSPSAVGAVAAA